MNTRIGFMGLGLMGGAMARNLLAAGYSVAGYDIDPQKVDAIVKAGGKKVPPENIPAEVDAIMLSLPNSHIVDDVVRNTLKLMANGRNGLIVIDACTADPQMLMTLAQDLHAKGITMLVATVSGTSEMAV